MMMMMAILFSTKWWYKHYWWPDCTSRDVWYCCSDYLVAKSILLIILSHRFTAYSWNGVCGIGDSWERTWWRNWNWQRLINDDGNFDIHSYSSSKVLIDEYDSPPLQTAYPLHPSPVYVHWAPHPPHRICMWKSPPALHLLLGSRFDNLSCTQML